MRAPPIALSVQSASEEARLRPQSVHVLCTQHHVMQLTGSSVVGGVSCVCVCVYINAARAVVCTSCACTCKHSMPCRRCHRLPLGVRWQGGRKRKRQRGGCLFCRGLIRAMNELTEFVGELFVTGEITMTVILYLQKGTAE